MPLDAKARELFREHKGIPLVGLINKKTGQIILAPCIPKKVNLTLDEAGKAISGYFMNDDFSKIRDCNVSELEEINSLLQKQYVPRLADTPYLSQKSSHQFLLEQHNLWDKSDWGGFAVTLRPTGELEYAFASGAFNSPPGVRIKGALLDSNLQDLVKQQINDYHSELQQENFGSQAEPVPAAPLQEPSLEPQPEAPDPTIPVVPTVGISAPADEPHQQENPGTHVESVPAAPQQMPSVESQPKAPDPTFPLAPVHVAKSPQDEQAIKDIFFYRDKEFQNKMESLWGPDLFSENTQTPETFATFWDNIHTKKSSEGREKYAQGQCNILKLIPITNMIVEFRANEGLIIRDKEDEDMVVILDYRESPNGELRGKVLADVLQEYAKNNKNGTVYNALTNLIHSHNNPTFVVGVKKLGIAEWAHDIVFRAIDNVLDLKNKLSPAAPYSPQDIENKKKIVKKFPQFLAELDEQNIQKLKEELEGAPFSEKKYSSERKNAIEKLLAYRETLFQETHTHGINLKNSRKASKCHFSEQMITMLAQNEPIQGQSFEQYIDDCIKKAEENLTPEEIKSWPKGIISHRLLDIITELRKTTPSSEQDAHLGMPS